MDKNQNFESKSEDKKVISLRKKYKFFLILGILGVIDIASRQVIGNADVGVLGYSLLFVFGLLLGADIGGTIASILSSILSLTVVYFVLAFIFYKKMQSAKEVKTGDATSAKKRSKLLLLAYIILGLFVLLFLLGGLFFIIGS